MTTVHLNHADPSVKAILRAAFPGYNGKHIQATLTDSVRFSGTNWDDGRKSEYVIVQLATLKTHSIHDAPYFQPSDVHSADYTIPPGFVVVQHDYAGQREYVYIIGPAANVAPMLPAPMELSADDKTVLAATAAYKSSYAGVSDYRYREARERTGITRERWDTAKAGLIGRKLLNAAGAITVSGRNAIGSFRI